MRIILFCLIVFSFSQASAQQFNSDSWFSKRHGTITLIPTYGQRSNMLMNTFSLFPRWEFTVALYVYNHDANPTTNDGYSGALYGKYMFYENKEQTGGIAVKAGTGMFPGSVNESHGAGNAFKTYWVNAPATLPLFDNKLSWDFMPGGCFTVNYGEQKTNAWSFTYSTRLAWYPFGPKTSFVGEVYGSTGEAGAVPEFKAGLRWEPSPYAVFAVTYGQEFISSKGAGFEIGIMLFTPPFACIGGCKN